MGLSLSKWKKYLSKIFLILLGVVFVAFIARVIIWENHYYREKEGSEREVATVSTEEVDETDVTANDLANYKVAADRPRIMTIEKIGVKARIIEIGINNKGELSTPISIFDVGWYFASAKPGETGTMLMDGHNGGPTKTGVFKNLPSLTKGDIITVERGDGTVFKYKVVDNITVSLEDADEYMKTAQTSPEKGKDSLSIITCTGEWSQSRRTYLSRQFLRAVLVDDENHS